MQSREKLIKEINADLMRFVAYGVKDDDGWHRFEREFKVAQLPLADKVECLKNLRLQAIDNYGFRKYAKLLDSLVGQCADVDELVNLLLPEFILAFKRAHWPEDSQNFVISVASHYLTSETDVATFIKIVGFNFADRSMMGWLMRVAQENSILSTNLGRLFLRFYSERGVAACAHEYALFFLNNELLETCVPVLTDLHMKGLAADKIFPFLYKNSNRYWTSDLQDASVLIKYAKLVLSLYRAGIQLENIRDLLSQDNQWGNQPFSHFVMNKFPQSFGSIIYLLAKLNLLQDQKYTPKMAETMFSYILTLPVVADRKLALLGIKKFEDNQLNLFFWEKRDFLFIHLEPTLSEDWLTRIEMELMKVERMLPQTNTLTSTASLLDSIVSPENMVPFYVNTIDYNQQFPTLPALPDLSKTEVKPETKTIASPLAAFS